MNPYNLTKQAVSDLENILAHSTLIVRILHASMDFKRYF